MLGEACFKDASANAASIRQILVLTEVLAKVGELYPISVKYKSLQFNSQAEREIESSEMACGDIGE
jgi:hypothetical protein